MHVGIFDTNQTAHLLQLLAINLDRIGHLERRLNDLGRIVVATKVDVTHLNRLLIHSGNEGLDGLATNLATLCQRAEANYYGMLCQILHFGSERDVIPRYILANIVLGNALLVEFDLHRAGRL